MTLPHQEGFFCMEVLEKAADLEAKVDELGRFIGNTPLYPITSLNRNDRVKIFAKLEWYQLGGSVKGRAAYQIFKKAINTGELSPEKRLLDASSGNTAIAYAAIGAKLGIGVTICLPDNASQERKQILKALGAELVLTSPFGGTDDSQLKARELAAENPGLYYYADQYNNDANWQAHYYGTAEEIYQQTDGLITHFVNGLGTTGTFTGTMTKLQELNPEIVGISLQPDGPMHGMEGWKHMETAIVPGIYRQDMARENWFIDTAEAYDLLPKIARHEGILVSPSSAANLVGALRLADQLEDGVIVTMFPDNAEKYSEVLKTML